MKLIIIAKDMQNPRARSQIETFLRNLPFLKTMKMKTLISKTNSTIIITFLKRIILIKKIIIVKTKIKLIVIQITIIIIENIQMIISITNSAEIIA
jgi:hypothetical protein